MKRPQKRVGPPPAVPDRCVHPDLRALARRPLPLIDRLEAVRDSDALKFNERHRTAIQEAIDYIEGRGR